MGRVGIMGYIWDIGQCRDKRTVLSKTVLPNDVPFQRIVFEKTVLRRLDPRLEDPPPPSQDC